MEEGKSSNADGDGEIHIPEPLIHHIQSFLDAKQAAQTTLVSKSWYRAWLIRPNVDLDELHFRPDGGASDSTAETADAFWDFVKKTMHRYEDLNIKIDSFKLGVHTIGRDYLSLSNALISKVLKSGIEDIHLRAPSPRTWQFAVSPQVFESETVVRLSLCSWHINRPRSGVVKLSNLKSLTLEDMNVKGMNINGMNVKGDYFSFVFPCLEDLTVRHCINCGVQFQISSCSLKRILLDSVKELKATFDVPNIRKVKFLGSCYPTVFPNLTILTVSSEWESDISLHVKGPWLSSSWPSHLKRFMNKLSGSKIFMDFTFGDTIRCDYSDELKGKQGPIVENLMLSMPSLPNDCPRFLAGLFWCSPPKFLTLSWFPGSCLNEEEKASNEFIRFLCEELMLDGENCSKIRNMFGNHGLGEVNVECSDSPRGPWQPLSSKCLLNASWNPETTQIIRFRLEWCASSDNVSRTAKASSSRIRAPSEPSTRNTRRRLNPPSSATSSVVNSMPPSGGCMQEVLQEYGEILRFLSGTRHNERALNRIHQRVELCIRRVGEELGIEFPALDNANDSTSGNYVGRTYNRIIARTRLLHNRLNEYNPNNRASGNIRPSPSGSA